MDILMNKRWIEDGYSIGNDWRLGSGPLNNAYYLDILGLFETSWITFIFEDREHEISCGYPR